MKVLCRLSRPLVQGWLAFGLIACVGCVSGPKPLTVDQRTAIQRRAEMWFTNAVLLKPCEPASTNELGYRLSPLIVQEIAPAEANAWTNASPLILLFAEGEAWVAGKWRQQVSFVWNQRVAAPRNVEPTSVWQGIRITLNAAGQPAIWEVLRDSLGAEVVFVSQNVETVALRKLGPARPGRRFAIEQGLGELRHLVVARAIDEGPVPMGPIVHVTTRGDITTVNCRCMTTQTRQLVAQGCYGLVPDQSAAEAWSRRGLPVESGNRFDQALRASDDF